jgi:hypothetical protein
MRQRAFIVIALCAAEAGAAVLSAQVTTTFKAEHERLTSAGCANALAKHLAERELLRNALLNPFADVTFNTQKVLPGGSVSAIARATFRQARRSSRNATGSRSPARHCPRRPIPPA